MRNTSLTERYTDLSNQIHFLPPSLFPNGFLVDSHFIPPLIRLYTKDSCTFNEATTTECTSRSQALNRTSLFKRCIQPAIYLKINSLLIHTLLFVKQFFFFCRTNPVGRFAQNVIFRIHPVWIAVFFVILRRAKHLLKRDLPLCPTKIPLNGKGSRGISQLTKCVWGYPIILICQ